MIHEASSSEVDAIIAALGTGQIGKGVYQRTTYVWPQRFPNAPQETDVFLEALANWFPDATMYVLLTPKAADADPWKQVRKALPSGRLVDVPIPYPPGPGQAPTEWEIFATIMDSVLETLQGQQVLIDITHAFRTIPIICLLTAAYGRVVYGIQVEALTYAGFEAKTQSGQTPVFDVSHFLRIMDWLTAARAFLDTGDARPLAEQAEGLSMLGTGWQQLSTALTQLSEALFYLRPDQTRSAADEVTKAVDDVLRSRTATSGEARAIQPLLSVIADESMRLAAPGVDRATAECRCVEWHWRRGHIVTAVALARECLVTWACGVLSKPPENGGSRQDANTAMRDLRDGNPNNDSEKLRQEAEARGEQDLGGLWDALRRLRNDLLHCGYPGSRKAHKTRSITDVENEAQQVLARFMRLVCPAQSQP